MFANTIRRHQHRHKNNNRSNTRQCTHNYVPRGLLHRSNPNQTRNISYVGCLSLYSFCTTKQTSPPSWGTTQNGDLFIGHFLLRIRWKRNSSHHIYLTKGLLAIPPERDVNILWKHPYFATPVSVLSIYHSVHISDNCVKGTARLSFWFLYNCRRW